MGKKSLHAMIKIIIEIEKAKTMGPHDGNKCQRLLSKGMGDDKRVDFQNKASTDHSTVRLISSVIQAEER